MPRDYKVRYATEKTLAENALLWRKLGDVNNLGYFDIVQFIETVLAPTFKSKGSLKINFINSSGDDDRAYVTYRPTVTLHVDSEVWALAKQGDPFSRYILAHEIGHILLHNHYVRQFSNDPTIRLNFVLQEESAEWQANVFAAHFLLPDHIVSSFGGDSSVASICAVPGELAQERIAAFKVAERRTKKFEGEFCRECGNFALVRGVRNLKCETCGAAREF
jgi:hypothetical protein